MDNMKFLTLKEFADLALKTIENSSYDHFELDFLFLPDKEAEQIAMKRKEYEPEDFGWWGVTSVYLLDVPYVFIGCYGREGASCWIESYETIENNNGSKVIEDGLRAIANEMGEDADWILIDD